MSSKLDLNAFTSIQNFLYDNAIPLLAGTSLAVAYKVRRVFNLRQMRAKWDSAGRDVVVLHAGGPSTTVPHASPFVMKLETYLKMSGIAFKHDSRKPYGSKGKMPWITLNGKDMADSQLILEHLGKKFDINFSKHLTDEEKAVGRAIQIMVEEHLLCSIGWWRFIADKNDTFLHSVKLPWIATPIFKSGIIRHIFRNRLKAQGTGNHSDEILVDVMIEDIHALSVFLGNKKFILGDEPCELDCTVFGFTSILIWGLGENPFKDKILSDYQNLNNYTIRMKEKFYPDWEQRLWKRA